MRRSQRMKIGIGVCTYNRLEDLKIVVENIRQNTPQPYKFVVSSDGSTDGTNDWLINNNIPCILGDNQGVMYNKNRLLTALQDCQYIFLLEDDIYPRVPEWVQFYIDGIRHSGYHHFCFKYGTKRGLRKKYDERCTVLLSPSASGLLMLFTREVLKVCGGFNTDYKGYGYGHLEFSRRIGQARLCDPNLHADVIEGNLAMTTFPKRKVGQRRTEEEIKRMDRDRKANLRLFKSFKKRSKWDPERFRYRDYAVPITIVNGEQND